MSAGAQFDPDAFMAGRAAPVFDPDAFMASKSQANTDPLGKMTNDEWSKLTPDEQHDRRTLADFKQEHPYIYGALKLAFNDATPMPGMMDVPGSGPMGISQAIKFLGAAAKAGGGDVAAGAGKTAAGAVLAKLGPFGEFANAITGGPLLSRGVVQTGKGLASGFKAGMEALSDVTPPVSPVDTSAIQTAVRHPLEPQVNPLEVGRQPQPFNPSGGSGVITYGPITPSASTPPAPTKEVLDGITKDLTEGRIKTFEKAPENVQAIVRQAASRIGTNLPKGTAAAPALPPDVLPASPVDTSAIQTADPFAQLRSQIDTRIAAGKEVEAAIPGEAGQNISPQEMANRRGVADRAAKYLASKGITSGQIDALRQTNPEMYESLWKEVGQTPGISRQAKYTPGAESGTRDMILERLSVLEGKGLVNPAVQPASPLNLDPKLLQQFYRNPQAAAAAMKLAQAMATSPPAP